MGRRLLFRSRAYSRSLGNRKIITLPNRPSSPFNGDPEVADRFFHGSYTLAGHTIKVDTNLPWEVDAPLSWRRSLHSFSWLDHFRAANGIAAQKYARHMVEKWLQNHKVWDEDIWSLQLIGKRLESWSANADFLLQDADPHFVSNFATSMSRQVRHLHRWAALAPSRLDEFQIGLGLLMASISLGQTKLGHRAAKKIEHAIEHSIQPDGTITDGSPSDILEVLRNLSVASHVNTCSALINDSVLSPAVLSLRSALQTLKHGDGKLSLFNGGFEEDKQTVNSIMTAGESSARVRTALSSLQNGGFERLSARRLLIIAHTGQTSVSSRHGLGALSFELSIGRDRLVVNCGTFAGDDESWKQAMQHCAAFSTLIIDNEQATAPNRDSMFEPVLRGEDEVSVWMELRHHGYRKKFGMTHVRRVHVHHDGHEVVGLDSILPVETPLQLLSSNAALRFHLHPAISASPTGNNREVLLRLSKGAGWVFETDTESATVEESIYMGRRGDVRRSQQIVVDLPLTGEKQELTWRFVRSSNRI